MHKYVEHVLIMPIWIAHMLIFIRRGWGTYSFCLKQMSLDTLQTQRTLRTEFARSAHLTAHTHVRAHIHTCLATAISASK